MNGWFAVKRGITNHPLFKGHPERLAIWLWLLDNACWADTPHDINGKTVVVPRGAVCASERRIAKEVGVGYQVVRTFLGRLKAEHMINAAATHGRNIITLCNYEKYQSPKKAPNAAPNAPLTHDQRTKEQDNNSLLRKGDVSAADIRKQIYDLGKRILAEAGAKKPGALITKWLRENPEQAVLSALVAAEGRHEPVAFIEGCLRSSRKRNQSDDDALAAQGIQEVSFENDSGNFSRGGDRHPPPVGHRPNDVSRVLPFPAEEEGPVPVSDVQTGRDRLALLALPEQGGCVL